MDANDILTDAFGRVRDMVHAAVDGLSTEQLAARLDPEANTIGWLVWHLARVQDDHVADLAEDEQVWTSGGWVQRFALPFDAAATGYGHSAQEVAQVRASAEQLAGYYDAVHERTLQLIAGLIPSDYERVVDRRWDPPVTLGVRLVSILQDDLAHAGQAQFVRGSVLRGG